MADHIGRLWGPNGPDDGGGKILNDSGKDILANASRDVGWLSHPQYNIEIKMYTPNVGLLVNQFGAAVANPLVITGGSAPVMCKVKGPWVKFEFEYTATLMITGNPKPLDGVDVVDSLQDVLGSLRDVLDSLRGVQVGVPTGPTWPPFTPRRPRIRVG